MIIVVDGSVDGAVGLEGIVCVLTLSLLVVLDIHGYPNGYPLGIWMK